MNSIREGGSGQQELLDTSPAAGVNPHEVRDGIKEDLCSHLQLEADEQGKFDPPSVKREEGYHKVTEDPGEVGGYHHQVDADQPEDVGDADQQHDVDHFHNQPKAAGAVDHHHKQPEAVGAVDHFHNQHAAAGGVDHFHNQLAAASEVDHFHNKPEAAGEVDHFHNKPEAAGEVDPFHNKPEAAGEVDHFHNKPEAAGQVDHFHNQPAAAGDHYDHYYKELDAVGQLWPARQLLGAEDRKTSNSSGQLL